MKVVISKYSNENAISWNIFLRNAKNSSFLFDRGFMDYHSDRFLDYSLIACSEGQIVAVLPANIINNVLISHAGLSYGGVILRDDLRFFEVETIFKEILIFLNGNLIKILKIKFIPRMYQTRPCDEFDWLLFKLKAKKYRTDIALVLNNRSMVLPYQERRRRSIKKVSNRKIDIVGGYDQIESFWVSVLIPNLIAKHGANPVHSVDEILLLAKRFPGNIKQHNIYLDGCIVAGCTMFVNDNVAHAQYISSTQDGRNSGCLDYLFDYLIKDVYGQFDFFDFGICNEYEGQKINKGLLDWKEGFGARAISHDFFELDTSNFNLLEDIYI